VGKEAKDKSSKGFSPVNRARTGHEAYKTTSYMMMMVMMITMTILI
jgi:hypothetical protein